MIRLYWANVLWSWCAYWIMAKQFWESWVNFLVPLKIIEKNQPISSVITEQENFFCSFFLITSALYSAFLSCIVPGIIFISEINQIFNDDIIRLTATTGINLGDYFWFFSRTVIFSCFFLLMLFSSWTSQNIKQEFY